MRKALTLLFSVWLVKVCAAPTIEAVFLDDRGFYIAAVEGAEFPYYWGHLSQDKLIPIYSNASILRRTERYVSEQRKCSHTLPVLLRMPSAARLIKGTLAIEGQTRTISGKAEMVGGTATLKSRDQERTFRFAGQHTLSFRSRLGTELSLLPHKSPTEAFLALDANQWRAGHGFVIDKELLPATEVPVYRVMMYDGLSLVIVGLGPYPLDGRALNFRFNEFELGFAEYDFGPHLPFLYRLEADPEKVPQDWAIQYIPLNRTTLGRMGYQEEPFPTVDSCVGHLLGM